MSIVIIADGEPTDPRTNSGVPFGLISALGRVRPEISLYTINGRLTGLRSTRIKVLSTVKSPLHARSEYVFGTTGIEARSRSRDRELAVLPPDGHVLHVRNVYIPLQRNYSAFVDSTTQIVLREWPKRATTIGDGVARIHAEREYLQNADVVFTAGNAAARSVINEYDVSPERVEVVGGGVRFDPLPEPLIRPRRAVTKVLFVGSDFERKGGDLLVAAVNEVAKTHSVELDIVGCDGKGMHQHPAVRFWGQIESESVLRDMYKAADIFAHPARHEPYGLVVLEAMSFGLPCVVSTVGDLPEIVHDGINGFTVGLSVDSLTRALESLIDDAPLREQMGVFGRLAVARDLTWRAVAERMLNAWSSRRIIV